MDHGTSEVTEMMTTDLSAASDTVDREILLEVLIKQYGVSGNALNDSITIYNQDHFV